MPGLDGKRAAMRIDGAEGAVAAPLAFASGYGQIIARWEPKGKGQFMREPESPDSSSQVTALRIPKTARGRL